MNKSPILQTLDDLIRARETAIHDWFDRAFGENPPPFYSSVDIRHSGRKLVPVDTNLFPAGFNILSAAAATRAVDRLECYFTRRLPQAKRVLIIPENHTRNLAYLENLYALSQIFVRAGKEVRIGSLAATETLELQTLSGQHITQQPLHKQATQLGTKDGFVPDLIVVNNDLSAGQPEILKGITQPIVPSLGQGWYRRRKTIHFSAYEEVARSFGQAFGLDPFLISAPFGKCGLINFHERTGLECVALAVEKMLHQLRGKYAELGIDSEPYVFIKADSGTYGMGIMTVRAGEEVTAMNKKIRNKMDTIKEGVQSTEVIVQEGIPSIDAVEGSPAEPMLYLLDGEPVGGAFRVNGERDAFENLNAQGMKFVGMCDADEAEATQQVKITHCHFKAYGLIARLASLAAAREEYGDQYMI